MQNRKVKAIEITLNESERQFPPRSDCKICKILISFFSAFLKIFLTKYHTQNDKAKAPIPPISMMISKIN